MPVTVSEIAERTGHGSDNRFIERLHYWTRERLLMPLGKRHPGTGKRRLYADSAVHNVAILNAMMEAQVPVAKQREVMKVVREDLERRMRSGAKERPDLLLVIEKYPAGQPQPQPYFHDGPYTTDPLAERTTTFNLTKLFAVLQPADLATGAPELGAPIVSVTTKKTGE